MFQPERRLKRGLSDISPLFQAPENTDEKSVQPHIQIALPEEALEIVSVWDAENPLRSIEIAHLTAMEIAQEDNPVTFLNLQDKVKTAPAPKSNFETEYIKSTTLSQNKFDEMWRYPVPGEFTRGHYSCKTLFLQFDYLAVSYIEKMVALLDKWVLCLRPTMESLTETYKLIKATYQLNKDLEYYVLLETPGENKDREAHLFERFSDLTARNFGISLNCAGSLEQPGAQEGMHCRLIQNLFARNGNLKRDTPEKVIVREWVESLQVSFEASA